MKIKPMNLSFYIAFILSIMTLFFVAYLTSDERTKDLYVQVELSADDTVWELAEKHADKHSLTYTEFISWVEENNGIEASEINEGLTITLPIKKQEIDDSIMYIADGEL
jgi:ABC-type metal ion transport system substrate-binding protein